jgi:hypothetical protein
MKRPSLAITALIIFWTAYGLVAAFALYQALQPLNRELFLILGGTGVILVIATLALLRRAPSDASVGGHGR